jgi:hypothetical protein
VLNRFTPQFLFLARNKLPEYYLVLAARVSGRRGCCVGFDGLCPAVKTRFTTIAPEVCAVVSATTQAAGGFLVGVIF